MRAPSETIAPEGFEPPAFGEPYLLTPGPLTTALSVKQAMLRDWGSWDGDFRAMTADLRRRLIDEPSARMRAPDFVRGPFSY